MSDDRLIVALDVANVVKGLELAARIGDTGSFYKIGLETRSRQENLPRHEIL